MRDVIRGVNAAPPYVDEPAREWLVTNGLGGYAFGTISGVITRGYHGYLIAALPTPLGRMMMLNDLIEQVRLPDGAIAQLGGVERENLPVQIHGEQCLSDFHLEAGLPVWRYKIKGGVLEKRVWMPHVQNTTIIQYQVLSDMSGWRLTLRPSMHFRPHNASVDRKLESPYTLTVAGDRYEISNGAEVPPLRFEFRGPGGALIVDRIHIHKIVYRLEEQLGYPAIGDQWSPGYFVADLVEGKNIVLISSTEPWEVLESMTPAQSFSAEKERRERLLSEAARSFHRIRRHGRRSMDRTAKELVLAADQFIIRPVGRIHDTTRAHAAGDEVRSVIAGYPWFTDWGRDTMISLEGLTLTTGRITEAGWILRTFAHSVRDGLIPNLFPERGSEGLYHTADATLWFFHALQRYLDVSGDRSILRALLPQLEDIVAWHLRGTRFGIRVDSEDGLLQQGDPTVPLTWMDARKDDWIVTPRRGKPVEINALWYNALRLLENWVRETGRKDAADSLAEHAERARLSFEKFWYAEGGYLYDVIDGANGNDASFRPNQLLAISLPYPVLDPSRWERVLDQVKTELLTPYGLRSLAPSDAQYKPTYQGDLKTRDAAYHQGTVWTWLIGPFIDAWLKVYPGRKREAREMLQSFPPHLSDACLGTISEIFDAEPPFAPRGCVAQAWSVAEVLRCWAKTAGGSKAPRGTNVAEDRELVDA